MIICHDVSPGDTLYLTAEDLRIAHIVPPASRLGAAEGWEGGRVMRALYQLEHSIRLVYIIGNLVGQLNKMLRCIIWQDDQKQRQHGNP